MDIENEISGFIAHNFLFRTTADGLDPTASLIGAGIIDSTGVLELVAWIEHHFGITVRDAEVVPENLDTIARLCAFVARKLPVPREPAVAGAAR